MKKGFSLICITTALCLLLSSCAVLDKGEELIDSIGFLSDDSLTFDSIYYPYYGMLSGDLQKLYRQIYSSVSNYKDSLTPSVKVSVDDAQTVILAVMNDHPELFWLGSSYKVSYFENGRAIGINLTFNMGVSQIPNAKIEFDKVSEEIIGYAGQMTTFAEREKYVHDYILNNAVYDSSDIEAAQSAYSAIVTKRTVCAGYSRAFQYLMTRLNIPTYYCTGYSSGDHAWNIVKLDDGYYNIDLTWDASNPVSYTYYNRADSEFISTHTRTGLSVYLPACTSYGYAGPEVTSYVLPEFTGIDVPQGLEDADISSYGEPITVTPEPIAPPVISTPELEITPEPITPTPEPVVITPEPVIMTPEPVIITPEPYFEPEIPSIHEAAPEIQESLPVPELIIPDIPDIPNEESNIIYEAYSEEISE